MVAEGDAIDVEGSPSRLEHAHQHSERRLLGHGRSARVRSRSTLAWPFCRGPAQCSRHVRRPSARRLSLGCFLRFPPPAMDLSRPSICDDPSARSSPPSQTRFRRFAVLLTAQSSGPSPTLRSLTMDNVVSGTPLVSSIYRIYSLNSIH